MVCFPPCLVRPGRRLPVQGLSEWGTGDHEILRFPKKGGKGGPTACVRFRDVFLPGGQ